MDSWNENYFMLMKLIPEEISSAFLDSNKQKGEKNVTKNPPKKQNQALKASFKTHLSISSASVCSYVVKMRD